MVGRGKTAATGTSTVTNTNRDTSKDTDTDTEKGGVRYVPLTEALHSIDARLHDALVSLSIAEIRPSVSSQQMVDTVNELHAAVSASVEAHELFVVECRDMAALRERSLATIQELLLSRKGSSVAVYRTETASLMDQVRLYRSLSHPSLLSATLAVTSTATLTPINITDTVTAGEKAKRPSQPMAKQKFKRRFRI